MESRRRRNLGFGSSVAVAMVAVLLCLILTTTSTGVSAQAPSPAVVYAGGPSPAAGGSDCFTSILSVSDCLTYVEAGSKRTTPEKGCCPSLAGLVKSAPVCLCQLLGNSSSLGIQLDVNRAINLPKVCRVDTPDVSLCAAIGLPIGVPTASPAPISPAIGLPIGVPTPSQAPISPGNNGSSNTPNSVLVFLVGVLSSLIIAIIF